MSRNIFIIFFLCLQASYAQISKDTLSHHNEINVSAIAYLPIGASVTAFFLHHFSQKHVFFGGLSFFHAFYNHSTIDGTIVGGTAVTFNSYNTANNFLERIGIIAGYQFHPYKKRRRINFYFEETFYFAHFTEMEKIYTRSTPPILIAVNKTGKYYVLSTIPGIGVKLKITSKIYVVFERGIGLSFVTFKADSKLWDTSSFILADDIKLGIGYDF